MLTVVNIEEWELYTDTPKYNEISVLWSSMMMDGRSG